MSRKKAAPAPAAAAGATVEQHLKSLGLLDEPPREEVFEVELYDATPIGINGAFVTLPKGKQQVSKQIYSVLKDANLIL